MKWFIFLVISLSGSDASATLYKRVGMKNYGRLNVLPYWYNILTFEPKSKIECGTICNMWDQFYNNTYKNYTMTCHGFSWEIDQVKPCKLFEIWSLDIVTNADLSSGGKRFIYHRPDTPSKEMNVSVQFKQVQNCL